MVKNPAAIFFILGKVKEEEEQPLLIKNKLISNSTTTKRQLLDAFVHLNNIIIYYHISRNMLTNP